MQHTPLHAPCDNGSNDPVAGPSGPSSEPVDELTLDGGSRDRTPVRTCIVTREEGHPLAMLRFVRGPEGDVVPDLKGTLPGRGAWVTFARSAVETAANRNLFARAFRGKADAKGLADRLDAMLEEDALARLAIARKAGGLVTGFVKCDALVREGEALALVHAGDAAADGRRKLAQGARATHALMVEAGVKPREVATFTALDARRLGERLGVENAVHIALRDDGAGRQAAAALARLERYRGSPGGEP